MTAVPGIDAGARSARVRRGLLVVARALTVATAVVAGYFVLPLDSPLVVRTGLQLLAGLAVLVVLLGWQVRAILRSSVPSLQALASILVTVPCFVVLFSISYYLLGSDDPGRFSEPLSRLDALYFTLTTFATVGFGDIVARAPEARAVVAAQMALGLLLAGVVIRVIVGVAGVARRRNARGATAGSSAAEGRGPIDLVLLELPPGRSSDAAARAIADLVERGTIRVHDLVLLAKDDDGTPEVLDATASASAARRFAQLPTTRPGALDDDVVAEAAAALRPGTIGALIRYENSWAAPFLTAVRACGGELVTSTRLPAADGVEDAGPTA
ncbi:DUF6325 family protein [Nocardioides marmotae]|uniref:DUF6325 family protein n=1 Tax=Nocardioides marmotae TaxID=2663857 RepID=UPI0012B63A06|nr:DUF6325 family protein [Nocardioides marmotae]MBC9734614.1 hypothetical protein [Nocardioides marmotae]MTB85716.1 hypothetical protein [Nocardioides marmotae]